MHCYPPGVRILSLLVSLALLAPASTEEITQTPVYARIKAAIDRVPAIDTHEHLRAYDRLPTRVSTPGGAAMTLYSIWSGSYFP